MISTSPVQGGNSASRRWTLAQLPPSCQPGMPRSRRSSRARCSSWSEQPVHREHRGAQVPPGGLGQRALARCGQAGEHDQPGARTAASEVRVPGEVRRQPLRQERRDQRHRLGGSNPVWRRGLHGAGHHLHAAVADANPRPGRVVEGEAARVTEPGALARIAKAWADNGWPAEPDDSGPGITAPFNAPSQGPPPWNVYRIKPRSAIVTLATQPGGLTRFRF